MSLARLFACPLLLACGPGARFLDDPDALLNEPVRSWTEEHGKVVYDGGVEDRLDSRGGGVTLVPGPLACEREVGPEVFLVFAMRDDEPERPANNTRSGKSASIVYGPIGDLKAFYATSGWVRIDERNAEQVRGAMSWVSEDEDGDVLAWAEGAFTVPVCDWTQ
jgi:hypothetical protein